MAEGRTNSFGKGLPKEIRITYRVRGNIWWTEDFGEKHRESSTDWGTEVAVYTRQIDDTYILTSGGSKGSPSGWIGAGIQDGRNYAGGAEIVNMEFVWD